MCQTFSGIGLKNGDIIVSEYTDSHEHLITDNKLKETPPPRDNGWARIEFVSQDNNYADIESYKLNVEAVNTVSWLTDEISSKWERKFTTYVKSIILTTGNIPILLGGRWILGGNAHVKQVVNSNIAAVSGSACIGDVCSSAHIGDVHGSAHIGDVSDSAHIRDVYGSAHIRGVSDSAHIRDVYGSAHIGDVSFSACIGDVYGSAHIRGVHGTAHIGEVSGSAHIGDVYSSAHIGDVHDSAIIGRVSGKAIIGRVSGKAKIIKDDR